jgi:pimeloyl-ACP methyl ester carboxylesterase
VGIHLPDGWQARVHPSWLVGWQPRPFDLQGGTTDVVVVGEGEPLLLLPPLPGWKEAWVAATAVLACRFRVVTFDLRVRFPGKPSWEMWLEDLERIADAFAPGRVGVVGHSLGGALAQRWALSRPERVASLVLSSSFARVGSSRGVWSKRYLEQPLVLASQRYLPEALAAPLARRFAARGAWVYDPRCDGRLLSFVRFCTRTLDLSLARNCVTLAFAHDTVGALAALRCPTLLVVGECETPWARAATRQLERLLPGAELRVSPGVSHLHLLSAAEWLAATITGWMERHLAANAPSG